MMPTVVALTGFSGAGKSTTIEILQRLHPFERVYLGAFVVQEVARRNMEPGAESERAVRLSLRDKNGPTAILDLAQEHLFSLLKNERDVVLDSLFGLKEYLVLCDRLRGAAPLIVLAVVAPFDVRASRLTMRNDRPISENDLAKRDSTEINELGINDVISKARYTVNNDANLPELQSRLEAFLQCCGFKH